MNVFADLDKLVCLLEKERANHYAQECLKYLKDGEVSFDPNTPLETKHLYEVYKNRFLIQKNLTKNGSVHGYPQVLEQLHNEKDQEIRNFTIATKIGAFVVFTTTETDRFIAILKSSSHTIARAKELNEIYRQRGIDVSDNIFVNRQLQSE